MGLSALKAPSALRFGARPSSTMSAFRRTGLRPRDKLPDLSEEITGEYLLFCLLCGISVSEGGDEGADD